MRPFSGAVLLREMLALARCGVRAEVARVQVGAGYLALALGCLCWEGAGTTAAQQLHVAEGCYPAKLSSFSDPATPFWSSETMVAESVLMISDGVGTPHGALLWPSVEILSVQDALLERDYERGKDWDYDPKAGELFLTSGSAAPWMKTSDLVAGGEPLFKEGHFFQSQQLAVTYRHAPGLWKGPMPGESNKLASTLAKLKARSAVELVVYGDSISFGYNASGFSTADIEVISPLMQPWASLVACQIKARYGAEVKLVNASEAGRVSAWGRERVQALVSVNKPDLVVIGFGMNDGSQGVSPSDFEANLLAMMDSVRVANPAAEFILVSPMLANPSWKVAGDQRRYASVFERLSGRPGVAVADVTSAHVELLKRKAYVDMTGNGVNHPNDFLIRWYAQLVGDLLGI